MNARNLLLGGWLLLGAPAALPGQTPFRAHDEFATDTLASYARKGDVTWEKGRVTLGPGARITRQGTLGYSARLRAVLPAAKDAKDGEVRVRFTGGPDSAAVALRTAAGRTTLINLVWTPAHVVALDAAGEGAWVVEVEVGFGLVQARAWREGKPMPADWQTRRYVGNDYWLPLGVGLENAGAAPRAVTALTVSGSGPPPAATPEQVKGLRRLGELDDKMNQQYAKGDFTAAIATGRELLDHVRKLYRHFPFAEPQILHQLAGSHQGAGELEEARARAEEALALREKAFPRHHPQTGHTVNNLGLILKDLGQFEDARRRYLQALDTYRASLPEAHSDTAGTQINLAGVLQELGRSDEALSHAEQGLAALRKVLQPRNARLGIALNDVGLLFAEVGRLDEAEALHREALALRRKVLPAEHHLTAGSLHNLGMTLWRQGRLKEAQQFTVDALAMARKVHPEGHPDLAMPLNNLGMLLGDLERPEEGLKAMEEALAIRKKALPVDHPLLLGTVGNLGALELRLGRAEAALALYEHAAARFRKVLPANHPFVTLHESDLAGVLHVLGRGDDCWKLLRATATSESNYLRYVLGGIPPRDQAGFLTFHRRGLDVLFTVATAGLSDARRQELLGTVLECKGIATTLLNLRQEALVLGDRPEARQTFERLRASRQAAANLLVSGRGRRDAEEHLRQCGAAREEVDRLERDLSRQVKDFARLSEAVPRPEQVAARLGPGAVLVEVVKYRHLELSKREASARKGEPRYAAVLLWARPGKPPAAEVRLVELGAAGPLERAIHDWRRAVQQGKADAKADAALRGLLWEPLAKALPAKAERLVVAPDGEVALVPFEAVRLADGSYLIERLRVEYLATGRDLLARAEAPQARPEGPRAVVLSDPAYDAGAAGGQPAVAPDGALRSSDFASRNWRFASLPGFAREADAVEKLLMGDSRWQVDPGRRAGASEEALLAVKRPRLLYLITHGFFLTDRAAPAHGHAFLRDLELVDADSGRVRRGAAGADPRLRSGLALAGANKWQERSEKGLSDGFLTALEVENLDLWGTELVVLSACDTGRGEIQVGEGVLGLRRAFQLAGARTVLASLWKVPDTETEQLMTDTLSRWLKGALPHEALREAQLTMIRHLRETGARNGKQEALPLYWAGFICHGR